MRSRGERVCAFIEKYCVVPDGELLGRPMHLEPFERRFILACYDNPKVTLSAILSIARKNGKTSLLAALVLAHLVGPEARRNTHIISGAQSREQAAKIYNAASKMVALKKELRSIVRDVPSGKRLIGLPQNVEYRAMSAEGKTAYGESPVLALLDEVGQVRGPTDAFIDAIVTSQGAHKDPLLITISTQAPNDGDLLSIWIDDALSKTNKDPHTICHLYTAPSDCALMDKEAWKAANPALGKFRSLKDVEMQAKKALRMPAFESTFRNYVLNQRVEMFSPFISKGVWVLNSQEPDPAAFYEGAPVYGGLDLSGRADLTAFVLVVLKEERWQVKAYFWTPEKGLRERSREARTPYDLWAKQGHIRVVPGASIDYEVVAKDMMDITEGMRVKAIAYDRWRFDLLRKELDEVGAKDLPLVKFGQGFRDMSPALDSLESLLLNEQLAHGGNPVLTMCAANSRVERDAAGNRKLSKFKATGRIDGMVALAEAIGVSNMPEERPASYQAYFL